MERAGGKAEEGESARETAWRELCEETELFLTDHNQIPIDAEPISVDINGG